MRDQNNLSLLLPYSSTSSTSNFSSYIAQCFSLFYQNSMSNNSISTNSPTKLREPTSTLILSQARVPTPTLTPSEVYLWAARCLHLRYHLHSPVACICFLLPCIPGLAMPSLPCRASWMVTLRLTFTLIIPTL